MEFFIEEPPEEELRHSGDPRVHVIAGACAGLVEHCGMFPIDTIKVGSSSPSSCSRAPRRILPPQFNLI